MVQTEAAPAVATTSHSLSHQHGNFLQMRQLDARDRIKLLNQPESKQKVKKSQGRFI